MATENYQSNSVVVPVFTGINDVPRVPTASEAGNGSDIIDRFNTLLGFLDTDIPALDTRLATAESTQSSQGSTISSLSTTQNNQQTTIDDHETRITTLESSGGGGSFASTITLDRSTVSSWSNWYNATLDNLTLYALYVPIGESFGSASTNLTDDFQNIDNNVFGGIIEFNNLEGTTGDLDISTIFQGAGIYLFWVSNLVPAGYGTSPGFPELSGVNLEITLDSNNTAGDVGVVKTKKDFVDGNLENSPWTSNKDYLLITSSNFDVRFSISAV